MSVKVGEKALVLSDKIIIPSQGDTINSLYFPESIVPDTDWSPDEMYTVNAWFDDGDDNMGELRVDLMYYDGSAEYIGDCSVFFNLNGAQPGNIHARYTSNDGITFYLDEAQGDLNGIYYDNLKNQSLDLGVEIELTDASEQALPFIPHRDISCGGIYTAVDNGTIEWAIQPLGLKTPASKIVSGYSALVDDGVVTGTFGESFDTMQDYVDIDTALENMFCLPLPEEAQYYFQGWPNTTFHIGKHLDFGNTKYISYMFCYGKAELIDLTDADVTCLIRATGLLDQSDTQTFLAPNWDVTALPEVSYMCSNAPKLQYVDLGQWTHMDNIRSYYGAFQYSSSLQYVDIRSWNITSDKNVKCMFQGVPADCLIIVKDDAVRSVILAGENNSHLTNIKTVAEYEG